MNRINTWGAVAAAVVGAGFVFLCAINPIDSTVATEAPHPMIQPSERRTGMEAAAEAALGTGAEVLKGWDSSFREPPLVFYDGDTRIDGEEFDEDSAAWYDGKVYIDTGTFYGSTTDGNFFYTIGHELGHGWEEHFDPYYPLGTKSELFGDCMAGAIAAAAGWDYREIADYGLELGTVDELHGTGQQRYDKIMGGATHGPEYCETGH